MQIKSSLWELLHTSFVRFSVFLDDIIDTSSIFYRIWGELDHHIRCLTRCMDVDISESENSLENPCCMGIDLLDTIERALTHIAWERWELLYTDHTRISDDEEIQFIIDPV